VQERNHWRPSLLHLRTKFLLLQALAFSIFFFFFLFLFSFPINGSCMVLWGFYGKMARFNHNKHHSSTAKLVFLISCAGLLGAALIADILWASSSSAAPTYLSIASSWALEKSRIVVVQNVTTNIAHHKVSSVTKCPILWVCIYSFSVPNLFLFLPVSVNF
jgi:hypothetical protein